MTIFENREMMCSLHFQVLVVGNPANTNCFICKKYAPSINAKNFSALTRLDQNRAQGQVIILTMLLPD